MFQFEFKFFFDHSSDHDQLRPDGLNANEMNKLFGGKKIMWATKIKDETYLGLHNPILKVGDEQ